MKVQVKDLKKGDELSSGAIVLDGPYQTRMTPSGKATLSIEYPNGNIRLQDWNKATTVTVTNR